MNEPARFRPGDTGKTNEGCSYEVLEYNGWDNIRIRVDGGLLPWETTVYAANLKKGVVKNKMLPSVYGVGVVGVVDVTTQPAFYRVWLAMLKRVYKPTREQDVYSYADCFVCEEWLYLPNFKIWYDSQIKREGWQLDKDFIVEGNREYGPDYCIFLPQELNKFFGDCARNRGDFPVGVTYNSSTGKYVSRVCIDGKNKYLGSFTSVTEAHNAYRIAKAKQAKTLAMIWQGEIDRRAFVKLLKFSEESII